MKIARVERKFDEWIIKWLSGMDRFQYSLEAREKVWSDIQTEWVELNGLNRHINLVLLTVMTCLL